MMIGTGSSRASTTACLAAAALLGAACSSNGGGTHSSSSSGAGGHTATSSSTGSSTSGGAGGQMRPPDPAVTPNLDNRPYDITVPTGYDPTKPAPLFLELHGFVDSTQSTTPWDDEEMANQFAPEANKRGIFFVLPHATIDQTLHHFFWNATDACCDLDNLMPDDVGYIMGIIADVESKYNIDPKRIFAFGHSNGGFMVNRLACDQADKFAGIVSLAGETYKDQSKCAASAPIAFLQVQGDADMTVPYAGGHPENIAVLPLAPGAVETTQDWAKKNVCNVKADTSQPKLTLTNDLGMNDTTPLVYDGCQQNGQTTLWTIHLGPHSPDFNTSLWAPMVFNFLMAHPRP